MWQPNSRIFPARYFAAGPEGLGAKQGEVDGLAHGPASGRIGVQMVAAVVRRPQAVAVVGIGEGSSEVNPPVGHPGVAHPCVDLETGGVARVRPGEAALERWGGT